MRTKLFVTVGVLFAVTLGIFVFAVQTEEWDCYAIQDGCKCVPSSTGGEGSCIDNNTPSVFATTGLDETELLPSRCFADSACPGSQHGPKHCVGEYQCTATSTYVSCNTLTKHC